VRVRPTRLFAVAAVAALVGAALLVAEVARTLGSVSLGTVAVILLWLGVGLLVAGSVGVTVAAALDSANAGAGAGSDG
jgi:hypothetical protein